MAGDLLWRCDCPVLDGARRLGSWRPPDGSASGHAAEVVRSASVSDAARGNPSSGDELVPSWIEGCLALVMLLAVFVRHGMKITVGRAITGVASMYCILLAVAMILAGFGCPWCAKLALKKQAWIFFAGGLFMIGYAWKGLVHAFKKGADATHPETHDAMPH